MLDIPIYWIADLIPHTSSEADLVMRFDAFYTHELDSLPNIKPSRLLHTLIIRLKFQHSSLQHRYLKHHPRKKDCPSQTTVINDPD